MKVIVAGSRTLFNRDLVFKAIRDSGFEITEIVSGGASGVDFLGEVYSKEVLNLEPKIFKAEWAKYGLSAGPRRNQQMADYADALIAVRLGNSRGTTDMIKRMKKMNKLHFVVDV